MLVKIAAWLMWINECFLCLSVIASTISIITTRLLSTPLSQGDVAFFPRYNDHLIYILYRQTGELIYTHSQPLCMPLSVCTITQ